MSAAHSHSANAASSAARLEATISNPGTVKINVDGAFIVENEPSTPDSVEENGVRYERKDIRLPHHTSVVSHIAVDVRSSRFPARPT